MSKQDGKEFTAVADGGDDGFIAFSDFEAGGILVDKRGNKFAIPANNTEELEDYSRPSSTHLDLDDPNFVVEWYSPDKMGERMQRGRVPVTWDEVGLVSPAVDMKGQYGNPIDSYVKRADCIALKVPAVIKARESAAENAEAKRLRKSLEPARALDGVTNREREDRAREAGISVRTEHESHVGDEPTN